MFLDWINEINLLSHNPETNILFKFPYSTKRILIYEITNCFIQQNNKTINNNINSYINNYSESPTLVVNNSPNQNQNLAVQPNTLTTKKSISNLSVSPNNNNELLTSTATSLNTVENCDNNIENNGNTNLTVENNNLDSDSINKINNTYLNPLEINTRLTVSKQDDSICSDNEANNSCILNSDNKEYMCESPCTETFISSPQIDSNIPWTWLTSVQHVQWVMEIIGQGFALPPTEENVKIIQNACAIYTQWLLDSNARPYIIQAKEGKNIEQIFWQKIFHHFSLLFQIN